MATQRDVAPVGLRERKKQKTRAAIQRVALRLFLRQGYEETTIEDIASAVEISPSTFFNYFPSKDDVVMLDVYDPMTIAMFLDRPPDEPPHVAFRRVLDGLAGILLRDRELLLAKALLMLRVPDLRRRIHEELERSEDMLVSLFARRTGRGPGDFELRVTSRVLLAAAYEAILRWVTDGGPDDLAAYFTRALDVVEAGARLPGRLPGPPPVGPPSGGGRARRPPQAAAEREQQTRDHQRAPGRAKPGGKREPHG